MNEQPEFYPAWKVKGGLFWSFRIMLVHLLFILAPLAGLFIDPLMVPVGLCISMGWAYTEFNRYSKWWNKTLRKDRKPF
jgi:1,4-dihydroxy-2-naphthoate octaprenyltransferase